MERAKRVDLHVFAGIDMQQPEKLDWLWGHMKQISRLELVVMPGSEDLMQKLLEHASFPKLEHLQVQRYDHEHEPAATPSLPTTVIPPGRLRFLNFLDAKVNFSSLAAHHNLSCLRIDHRAFSHVHSIALSDFVAVLPQLSALEVLTLACSITIEEANYSLPSISLPSIHTFSYHGQLEDVDCFLRHFNLPCVTRWHLHVRQSEDSKASMASVRGLISSNAFFIKKVALQWWKEGRVTVALLGAGRTPRFRLYFGASGSRRSPCQTFLGLLDGVGSLPDVYVVALNGGATTLDVSEPDDEVIESMMSALPNVTTVTIAGNASSWVRVPLILAGRLRVGVHLWWEVTSVSFLRATVLAYVVVDWAKWLDMRRRVGRAIMIVRLEGVFVQAGIESDCAWLKDKLEDTVDEVSGKFVLSQGDAN